MTYSLLASLFIHLILSMGVNIIPLVNPSKTSPVYQVEIIEKEAKQKSDSSHLNRRNQKIVGEVIVPENQLTQNDSTLADYLSNKRQRVKKETILQKKSPLDMVTTPQASASTAETMKAKQKDALEVLADRVTGAKKIGLSHVKSGDSDFKISSSSESESDYSRLAHQPEEGISAQPLEFTNSFLNDVAAGSMTALNTDQYLFYSFFSRVQSLVGGRWSHRVEAAWSRMDTYYFKNFVKGRDWITQVDIWLNPNGEFHSAHLLKESGLKDLDRAAIMAFKEAHIFSNPPKELVEDDGFVHLRYNLRVQF